MKTFLYIDGFNLYYSALKRTPHKWLDLKVVCQKILAPHHDIVKIKYFTARVSGKIDPLKKQRASGCGEKVFWGRFSPLFPVLVPPSIGPLGAV